jgi:Galactose-3-O-sulfotransferase
MEKAKRGGMLQKPAIMESNRLIIFVHLPKTAGSTLRYVIERQYEASAIVKLYESDFGEEVEAIPPRQLERCCVIMGHFYFGVHAFLSKPFTYVTLLRDPVERVISHYYYARLEPAHYFHAAARKLRLQEFVEYCSRCSSESGTSLGYCSDNDQTRQLAGRCGVPSCGTSSAELLSIAKKNLAKYFSIVGIAEEFDRSLMLMKRILGWSNPFYTKQNVSRVRGCKEDLSPETLSIIEAYNALDIELYRYAKQVFEAEIRSRGKSFEREVQKFQRLNGIYGWTRVLLSNTRKGPEAQNLADLSAL